VGAANGGDARNGGFRDRIQEPSSRSIVVLNSGDAEALPGRVGKGGRQGRTAVQNPRGPPRTFLWGNVTAPRQTDNPPTPSQQISLTMCATKRRRRSHCHCR